MKYILPVIIIVLAALSIYFGAYTPLVKARNFVSGLRGVSFIQSVQDFKENFDPALEFPSPIGDEEILRFLGSDLVSTLSSPQNPVTEEAARTLVEYLEEKLIKDDTRHLIILGQLYGTLWQRYGNESDFEKSEQYLLKARELGPKLPPVLLPLFDLYQKKGDAEGVRDVGGEILRYWPGEGFVKEALGDL